MSEGNKAVLRRWFDEVWNQGREETIDELFRTDCIAHGLGESEIDVHGPEEFKAFHRTLRGAIPDVKIRIEDVVAEGDKVVGRLVLEGTHTGDTLGVPASGQSVRVEGLVLVRFEAGRIIEGWNSWDQLGLLRQIGAIPGENRFLKAKA
jgi:steroid delta-isomerase-like uncharacterized protein